MAVFCMYEYSARDRLPDVVVSDVLGLRRATGHPLLVPGGVSRAMDAAARATLRVLVVDDNRDAAISLALLLNLTGTEASTAFDGEEALMVATHFDPDLVLLDIGMPKLNGYEVCRRLRARPGARAVVIVALTGWGQAQDRRRSAVAGFDLHLVKPLNPRVLLDALTLYRASPAA